MVKNQRPLWDAFDDSWRMLEDQIKELLNRKVYQGQPPAVMSFDGSSHEVLPGEVDEPQE